MPAWFVITAHVHDREPFVNVYSPAAAKLAGEMGGKYIVRGRGGQVMEGNDKDGAGAVVIEWPDRESALRFWNSPEYAEIKKLRDDLADVTVTLVDG
ncbi:DUF1330 domain-containing protein [Parasphingorhabdus sp.]|uniref:DUF1330 domain-containing protein n=1 Tax=Parasphingorhabdus sp. TaxID=2709688 RepID=UPI0032652E5B